MKGRIPLPDCTGSGANCPAKSQTPAKNNDLLHWGFSFVWLKISLWDSGFCARGA
ncbi:hypothetical protein PSPHG_CDS_0137 [Pseudomonas phage Psxphi15]